MLLPGDPLPSSASQSATTLHVGPGLQSSAAIKGKGKQQADAQDDVFATRAGLLGCMKVKDGEKWWIEGEMRRVSSKQGLCHWT